MKTRLRTLELTAGEAGYLKSLGFTLRYINTTFSDTAVYEIFA